MAPFGAVRSVRPPNHDTVVSVCRKCAGDASALQAALKKESKRRSFGKRMRAVTVAAGAAPALLATALQP